MKKPNTPLKAYFLTGLVVLVPLAITFWVLNIIVSTLDNILLWLPNAWQPEQLFGMHIPGVGVVLTLAIVLFVGLLTHNFIGQKLIKGWNWLLRKIPVIGSIHNSVKQVSDTLLSGSGHAFREAVLIQYPRPGIWAIAFVTGQPGAGVEEFLPEDCISVYLPTTPNPTSGFFLILPRAEVINLPMSVDVALKYIVSMGVVAPQRDVD